MIAWQVARAVSDQLDRVLPLVAAADGARLVDQATVCLRPTPSQRRPSGQLGRDAEAHPCALRGSGIDRMALGERGRAGSASTRGTSTILSARGRPQLAVPPTAGPTRGNHAGTDVPRQRATCGSRRSTIPAIEQPTDALVRVTIAGICGSDLHVFHAGEAFGFPAGLAPRPRVRRRGRGGRRRGPRRAAGRPGAVVVHGGLRRVQLLPRRARVRRAPSGSMFGWAPRALAARRRRAGRPVRVRPGARWPTTSCARTPEALTAPDHAPTLLPLIDVMSTGWHGLTSAGFGAGPVGRW